MKSKFIKILILCLVAGSNVAWFGSNDSKTKAELSEEEAIGQSRTFLFDNNPSGAIDVLQKAYVKYGESEAICEALAYAFSQDAQYASAAIYFDKAFKLSDNNAFLALNAARAYEQCGILDSALSFYEKYLELKPKDFNIWKSYISLLEKNKNYKKALNAYDGFLSNAGRNPYTSEAYDIADLYLKQKDYSQAQVWFEAALKACDESNVSLKSDILIGLMEVSVAQSDIDGLEKYDTMLELINPNILKAKYPKLVSSKNSMLQKAKVDKEKSLKEATKALELENAKKLAEAKHLEEEKASVESNVLAIAQAKKKAEAEAKANAEKEEKERLLAAEKAKEEANAKKIAEAKRLEAEATARLAEAKRLEAEANLKLAEARKLAEAKARAEAEAKKLAEEKRIAEEKLAETKRIEENLLAEYEAKRKSQAEEKAKVEAELERLAEEKRITEEKLAEAKRLAEEKRIAEEKAKAEAEAKRLAEEKRIAEEKAKAEAEAKRLAEEKRIAEEKAKAEAEAKRLAEEKRIAEEKAKAEAEAKRLAEEKRIAEEKAKAEAEAKRLAEEKRIAEEKAKAEAEAKRLAEEKRIAEEKAKAEAEAKRLAEEKRIAEEKAKAEAEAKRLAEEKRIAEEKAIAEAEAKRLAEEKRIAEVKRLEEERLLAEAEAKRLEEEAIAKLAEAKKLEDEAKAKLAEAKRLEEAKIEDNTNVIIEEISPENEDIVEVVEISKPVKIVEIEEAPTVDKFEVNLFECRKLLERGEYVKAENLAHDTIAMKSDSSRAWRVLAEIYQAQGMSIDAFLTARQALSQSPDDLNCVLLHLQTGALVENKNAFLANLIKANKKFPDNSGIILGLARTFAHLGNATQAKQYYNLFLKNAPREHTLYQEAVDEVGILNVAKLPRLSLEKIAKDLSF